MHAFVEHATVSCSLLVERAGTDGGGHGDLKGARKHCLCVIVCVTSSVVSSQNTCQELLGYQWSASFLQCRPNPLHILRTLPCPLTLTVHAAHYFLGCFFFDVNLYDYSYALSRCMHSVCVIECNQYVYINAERTLSCESTSQRDGAAIVLCVFGTSPVTVCDHVYRMLSRRCYVAIPPLFVAVWYRRIRTGHTPRKNGNTVFTCISIARVVFFQNE